MMRRCVVLATCLWVGAVLAVPPAAAQAPNHFAVVQQVNPAGIGTHEGQAAFTDAVVCALHAVDAKWGHLRKDPGRTQIHGHAEDSALYAFGDRFQSVDFIASGGAPNASPAWQPDIPRYAASDWLPPHNCGQAPPAPPQTPPVDLSQVLARLDALTRQIDALGLQVAAATDQANAARIAASSARSRIEDTLTAVDLARQAINRPPIYTGRILGLSVTFRPTVHPANP